MSWRWIRIEPEPSSVPLSTTSYASARTALNGDCGSLTDSTPASSRLMSWSCGEVKGWWAAIHCFSPSSHSNMGKFVTQRKRKSFAASPVFLKMPWRSAYFCASAMRSKRRLRPRLRGAGDQHDQIAVFGATLFSDRGRGVGKLIGDALEILVHARAALGVEHGLDVVALF